MAIYGFTSAVVWFVNDKPGTAAAKYLWKFVI